MSDFHEELKQALKAAVESGNFLKLNLGKKKTAPVKIADLTSAECAEEAMLDSKREMVIKTLQRMTAELDDARNIFWAGLRKAHNLYEYSEIHIHKGALYKGLAEETQHEG